MAEVADTPITVVVPTRDRPAMLRRCLASLTASVGPDDEIVVVDSASSDPAVLGVADGAGPGVRSLRCDQPGASRARNAGWRAATHRLVAFVDDDVVVSAAWAGALRSAATEHDGAAFFTGRVEAPPGTGPVEHPIAIKDEPDAAVLDASATGLFGHSANMAARLGALVAVGGFDEALGAGGRYRACEDADLFDRLLAAGFTGRYEPAALAFHDQWRDRTALLRLDWAYGIGAGARVAKLVRADRVRARAAARDFAWVWGLKQVPPALRAGYRFGVAAPLVRVAGSVVGFARAIPVPVRDGHLSAR
ncbi:MAG: glycosyl transferase family 2 [Acidimicrobiales bacterium]|nr:glycosyl transferase family 2 [Acidimicrobiales bacterium]